MCDPLEKNLLFLHGMLRILRKNLRLPHEDTLGVLGSLGKNLLLSHLGLFKYAWVHRGRIFCLLHGDDVLDMLDPLGEESYVSLLGIRFLNLCDLLEMVLGCTRFIGGIVFYFLYCSLGGPW